MYLQARKSLDDLCELVVKCLLCKLHFAHIKLANTLDGIPEKINGHRITAIVKGGTYENLLGYRAWTTVGVLRCVLLRTISIKSLDVLTAGIDLKL